MEDNLETINCPACGCEMEKIYMPAQGVHLDVCTNGCGGIYFDNREFKKFDEPCEDITPLIKVLEGKEFKKVDEEQVRNCPVCGNRMMKNFASIKHEVQVDECYTCGGKFLDYGELEKIRSQYNTESERASDVVKQLYKEVGSELLVTKSIPKRKSKNIIGGLIWGIFFAVIYLLLNTNNFTPEKINSLTITTFGIILAFTVIGFISTIIRK